MTKFFRTLFVITALSLGFTVSARDNNDSAHFGVRATFDYTTTTSYNSIIHWGPGFSAGAAYYAPFGKVTYFNVALMLFNDTYKYDGWTGEDTSRAHLDGSLTMFGIKMPLQVGVKYYESEAVRLGLYTGPQLCYNLSMRSQFNRTRAGDVERIAKTINSNGMDLAWTIGASADICKHWHVHAEYSVGVIDFVNIRTLELGLQGSLKRSELSVGVGYNF